MNAPYADIARGYYTGFDGKRIAAENHDVGTGAFEDIWQVGGVRTWITSAEKIQIRAGGNAADDAGGSGALTVLVRGLDYRCREIFEILTTAGANASAPSAQEFLRTNEHIVTTVGTYGGSNTGDIAIEGATTSTLMGEIEALHVADAQVHYSIPFGRTGLLFDPIFEVDGNQSAHVRLRARRSLAVFSAPYGPAAVLGDFETVTGDLTVQLTIPVVIPSLTDFWIDAQANGGSGIAVDFAASLMLVPNV